MSGTPRWRSLNRRLPQSSYREFVATAPDELMTIVVLTTAPAAPFLPASVHGQSVVIIGVCYAGSVDEGEGTRRCSTPGCRTGSGTTGSRSTWRRSATP